MKKTAVFFSAKGTKKAALEPLMECCKAEGYEIKDCGEIKDSESFVKALPSTQCVVFLPAIEEDCEGIKLAQDALVNLPMHVVIMYASSLPSKEYLCFAFREAADDIIVLGSERDVLDMQMKRAERLLEVKSRVSDTGGYMEHHLESLASQCKHMEQNCAHVQEQLLAVASTARRIATGQLNISETCPQLLIVATSHRQAENVEKLASSLGFETDIMYTGKDALQWLKDQEQRPDVIITDGTLSDMDAANFAKSARQALGNHPVVIIVTSSNHESEEAFLEPESGIDDFVLKSSTDESKLLLSASLLGGLR
jgi:PleD family two-component response regulator